MVCLPYIDRSSPIYRQFALDIQIIPVPSIDCSRPIHSSFVKEVQFLAYVLHIQLVLCKKHGCIFCILCIRSLFLIFSEKPLSLKESFRLLFVRNKARKEDIYTILYVTCSPSKDTFFSYSTFKYLYVFIPSLKNIKSNRYSFFLQKGSHTFHQAPSTIPATYR